MTVLPSKIHFLGQIYIYHRQGNFRMHCDKENIIQVSQNINYEYISLDTERFKYK